MHKDADHKIAMCGLGLVTGSGYLGALESVKEELLSKEISHTDQILEIIKQRALPKIKDLHRNNPRMKDNTCFLLSYRTILDNENILRLALIHPKWNYQLGYYEDATVVMPSDSNEEEAERYMEFLRETLIRFEDKKSSDEEYTINLFKNLFSNAKLIGKCFCEISQRSSFVSRDLDFSALFLNGSVIYGYGESDKVMEGILRLSIIPSAYQTRFLTPDIFNEGKSVDISI